MRLRWPWRWPWRKPPQKPPQSPAVVIGPPLDPGIADDVRGAQILRTAHVETPELGELAKLPPFPPVVISLLRLFDRSDVRIDEVANLVASDPSIASEMLAVVNSPLFGVRQPVLHASHAVSLLGIERSRSLAAALAMRSLAAGGPRTPVVRRFWSHGIATATIARHFAKAFQIEAGTAYVTGLMHDLGRNGLLAAYREDYSRLACAAHESTARILAEEEAAFGMTHCQAGELLAKAWDLPALFQDVARHHHDQAPDQPAVALIALACSLADDLMFQAIHREDVRKPLETIACCAPESLREYLAGEIEALRPAIDAAIDSLDF